MRSALANEPQSRTPVASVSDPAEAADVANHTAAESVPRHEPQPGRTRQVSAPVRQNRSVANDVTLLVLLVISILVLSVVVISNQNSPGPSGSTPDRIADVEKTKQEFASAQPQDGAVQPGRDEAPAVDKTDSTSKKVQPDEQSSRSDLQEEPERATVQDQAVDEQAKPAKEQEAAGATPTSAGKASQ